MIERELTRLRGEVNIVAGELQFCSSLADGADVLPPDVAERLGPARHIVLPLPEDDSRIKLGFRRRMPTTAIDEKEAEPKDDLVCHGFAAIITRGFLTLSFTK